MGRTSQSSALNQIRSVFSALSAGQAATKGCWTVIGPNNQCLVLDKDAEKLREALKTTKCLQLEKKRGSTGYP